MFKVESNFPELRPSNTQDAVKIVSVILPVVDHKRDLRTDCFAA